MESDTAAQRLSEYMQEQDADYPAHGWIQWKGTDVCIDLHCPCGRLSHFDGEFFYFFECGCGARYAVGATVKLIPLPAEHAAEVLNQIGFKRDEDDEVIV